MLHLLIEVPQPTNQQLPSSNKSYDSEDSDADVPMYVSIPYLEIKTQLALSIGHCR
jgi:hypothetical protein